MTVAQAGEGADELFFGYPSWATLLRLQEADDLPVPRAVKRGGLSALRLAGRATSRPYEYLRRGAEGVPVFWGGAEAFTEEQKQRLLSPRLRRELAGIDVVGRARPDPRPVRRGGGGAVARQLDELPRPAPPAARAAADADRQDEHGRVARGARSVSRPPVRRAGALDPDERQEARRRVEARAARAPSAASSRTS